MDQKTINTYNQQAQQYDDQTKDFWDKFPRTFINKFAGLARGKVLDVGCGPGRDGLLLKEAGLEVVGVDASETMVAICQEKGLQSVVGDFSNLPFNDQTFDAIWTYTSWLHVPKDDINQVIDEARRVLKNSGVLALGMIEGDFNGYRENKRVTSPRWFSYYQKSELEKLLVDHGFEVVYFEEFHPVSDDYKNTKNYLNFIARKI